MVGGHLGTDARLIFRHHRIEETCYVNAFLEQRIGEILRQFRISQHHRDDGMIGAGQGKTCGGHFFAEQTGVAPQAVAQRIALFQQFQHFNRRGDDRRRQRVGEQIRARALTQPLHQLFFPAV